MLLNHLRAHTIELALVDEHLKKYRGHQLTHEIHYLFDAVNAISNSSGDPFSIEGTVKKLEDYWKLCTYQNAANSILVLKQTMDLQGDFKIVETLAQEVRTYMCTTLVTLIIRTVKNNYFYDRSALKRKQINYPPVVFECIRAACHLKC